MVDQTSISCNDSGVHCEDMKFLLKKKKKKKKSILKNWAEVQLSLEFCLYRCLRSLRKSIWTTNQVGRRQCRYCQCKNATYSPVGLSVIVLLFPSYLFIFFAFIWIPVDFCMYWLSTLRMSGSHWVVFNDWEPAENTDVTLWLLWRETFAVAFYRIRFN